MHDATRFLFYKDMALEENVFRGPSMVFTDRFNPRAHTRHMEELRPTLVKSGARLGADGTTICGCPIGRYAFVGADTVMTKDDASHALVVGNPARPVGWRCKCGEKLHATLQCDAHGASYRQGSQGLERYR